jgi:glutamate N-acetyltransferase/amino-acid N-acetyltransferase
VGKSGARIERERISIRFGPEWTAIDGGAARYDEAALDAHMRGDSIAILVRLGLGEGRARMWTCDLTEGYIRINGAYRS